MLHEQPAVPEDPSFLEIRESPCSCYPRSFPHERSCSSRRYLFSFREGSSTGLMSISSGCQTLPTSDDVHEKTRMTGKWRESPTNWISSRYQLRTGVFPRPESTPRNSEDVHKNISLPGVRHFQEGKAATNEHFVCHRQRARSCVRTPPQKPSLHLTTPG